LKKSHLVGVFFLFGILGLLAFFPETAFAQFAGNAFESKMQNLTMKLITVMLPLMSVIGLIYAVILALTGDGAARPRIVMVIACSVIGFLAPHIISWFQSAAGQ